MGTRTRWTSTLLAIGTLWLAGCDDGDGTETDTTTTIESDGSAGDVPVGDVTTGADGGDLAADGDVCTPIDLCAEIGASCGAITGDDGCTGEVEAMCGTCTWPEICTSGRQCGLPTGWFGIAGSDYGPWETPIVWHSGAGAGVDVPRGFGSGWDAAIADNGDIFVVWDVDLDGMQRVLVTRFDGTVWGRIDGGGVFDEGGSQLRPAIAIAPDGTPHVAARLSDGLRIARWDGAAWQSMGTWASDTVGGYDLAWDRANDTLALVWEAGNTVSLTQVNDAGGQPYHGSETVDVASVDRVELAFGPGGPVVGYSNGTSPRAHGIYWWDGTAWVRESALASSAGTVSPHARHLAPLVDGDILTAFPEGSGADAAVALTRMSGAERNDASAGWTGISPAVQPTLSHDGAQGPLLAWSQRSATTDGEIFVQQWVDGEWIELAPGSASGGGATDDALPNSNPLLLANDTDVVLVHATNGLWVERLDTDGQWTGLGPSTASGGGVSDVEAATRPLLGRGQSNDVVLIFDEGDALFGRRLATGQDAAWQPLGEAPGLVVASGGAGAMTTDADGKLALVYRDGATIAAASWDGAAWSSIGGPVATLEAAGFDQSESDVALAGDGRLVVVWSDVDRVFARAFDGTTWQDLGDAVDGINAATGRGGRHPSIAADGDGRPVIAWEQAGGSVETSAIYTRAWDGAAWVELGTDGQTNGVAGYGRTAEIGVDGTGAPVVAWISILPDNTGTALEITRLEAGEWRDPTSGQLGSSVLADAYRTFPEEQSMAVDSTGALVVAFSQNQRALSGPRDIRAMRLVGQSWEPIRGSDREGGISNSPSGANNPVVATFPDLFGGLPATCIAWDEVGDGRVNVVMRCALDE